MASVTDICNRAIQKLGGTQITSISEDSRNARACLACYETLRDSELQAHPWNFAVSRVSLAADMPGPDWGPQNIFTLPANFLRLADPDLMENTNDIDFQIEGRKLRTSFSAPLNLRIIIQITDVPTMDPLFREALSAKMAKEMCETITQSNSKKAACDEDYKAAIREARRANAFARRPQEAAEDSWITGRS